jgi:hypothetical protein
MKLLLENWREYLNEGRDYHWHSSPPSEEIQGVIDANTANVKCRMGELACQDMSIEWANVFRDAGFDVEIHHGTYKEEGHSWLVIDGLHIFDPTAGFVCYRRAVLEAINLDEIKFIGYAFQIEMKYNTHIKKFNIKEIPIIFTDRLYGVSKLSKGIIKEAIFGVIQMRLKTILGNR